MKHSIYVERPKNMFGKRSKRLRAYTGNPTDPDTVEICNGELDETPSQLRARATALLALALERRALEVRSVSPGWDGAAADVWILSGDPVRGYSYGRVYAYGHAPGIGSGEGRPTLHVTVANCGEDLIAALTAMLTHMADTYPEETWPQFLWSNVYAPYCGQAMVDVAAIRREISQRDAARRAMVATSP